MFQDCYAKVDIDAPDGRAAGFLIAPSTYGDRIVMNNCYWSGTNTATWHAGSFVDFTYAANAYADFQNCYYDEEKFPLCRDTPKSGTGLTTAQMKTQSSYVGWDFENTWYMGEDGYPELKFD